MILPDYVNQCIARLEDRGFAAYAVGGCVRDALLGLSPQDYDLCTAALPEDMEEIFRDHTLVLAGKKHGTVGVVTPGGVVEITTFRAEGGYRDSRRPDWVEFLPDITGDLARRDFTVNAMAYSPTRGFADPFGGREDLKNGILRCVGVPELRLREDALRILRGVRFAVRFRLQPEEKTLDAMFSLADQMEHLARERVFAELCKLLPLVTAQNLLTFAPVLTQVIPELKPTLGFHQHSRHHKYDIYTHTAQVAAAVPGELTLRWAALLHDIGKPQAFTLDGNGEGHFYGHAGISAEMADTILRRLKAPTALRERVVLLIDRHMHWFEISKPVVKRWTSRLGAEAMEQLLTLQEADTGGKGTGISEETAHFSALWALFRQIQAENACLGLKDLAVNGHDLIALGLQGPEIGSCLQRLLSQVLEETLPNTRQALLRAAAQSAERYAPSGGEERL